ncbi:MAG: hypothetical protein AAGB05_10530 [Pseudomonadota bacterium]
MRPVNLSSGADIQVPAHIAQLDAGGEAALPPQRTPQILPDLLRHAQAPGAGQLRPAGDIPPYRQAAGQCERVALPQDMPGVLRHCVLSSLGSVLSRRFARAPVLRAPALCATSPRRLPRRA